MRKLALALLLFALSLSFAVTYGYSRITFERTWDMHTNDDSATVGFEAALAANNSDQKIVALVADQDLNISTKNDSTVWVSYYGQPNTTARTFKAKVIVDVDYDPHITSDPAPDFSAPAAEPAGANTTAANTTGLTSWTDDMSRQARMIASDNSTLETIRNLAEWVHGHVEYDISYWGKTKSARDVYGERKGVCVEYTHLFLAMARSLGFQARYVNGYVNVGSWQPHAWADVYLPDYGWLSVDPTFGQVGVLDSTHVALAYGNDQASTYDLFLTKTETISLEANDNLDASLTSENPKGAEISISADNSTYLVDVAIRNTRGEYMFGSYAFLLPETYGGESYSILLLRPGQTLHQYQAINRSRMQDGYSYNVDIGAAFNDAKVQKTVVVKSGQGGSNGGATNGGAGNGGGPQPEQPQSPCPSALLLFAMPLALLLFRPG